MQEVINGKRLKNKKLLVICPTRERIEKVKEYLQSFEEKTSDETGVLFVIDKDDPTCNQYQSIFEDKWPSIIIEKRRTCIQIYNYVANILYPNFEAYMPSNDDFVFLTNLWDIKLLTKMREHGGWAIVFGDDRIQGENMPTTPVISGNIVRALGYLQLPSLTHLFADNAVKVLGQGLGRIYYESQVVIQHKHFADKKTQHDIISLRTNSPQMYETDQKALKLWFQKFAKADISRVVAAIHKEAGYNKTISLAMICGDFENPKVLQKFLESIKNIVAEVNIVFNYKHIPQPWKVKRLESAARIALNQATMPQISTKYIKWDNFSSARNESLKMATKDYVLWGDCDDQFDAEWMVPDAIFLNSDIDAFRCVVVSYHSHKGPERVLQYRFFKNHKGYEFRNNVHEDVSFSMGEKDARLVHTNIQVHHFGNLDQKRFVSKTWRNYRLTLKEINSEKAHSLTYYALVNELLVIANSKTLTHKIPNKDIFNTYDKKGYKYLVEAIHWIDEYFNKFPDSGVDPLVPKMWVLRGVCALDCGQLEAARTNFAKGWNGWKHPEAGVMLAECHIRKQEWDQAIELLEEMNKTKDFTVCNIPIDMETIELSMLYKLGFSYDRKAESIYALKATSPTMYNEEAHKMFQSCLDNAQKYYEQYLTLVPNNRFIGDRLVSIYRDKGKANDANFLTVSMVNMFPDYAVGWKNLATFELMSKRYVTASVFFREALRLNPNDKDVKHNLDMIRRSSKHG